MGWVGGGGGGVDSGGAVEWWRAGTEPSTSRLKVRKSTVAGKYCIPQGRPGLLIMQQPSRLQGTGTHNKHKAGPESGAATLTSHARSAPRVAGHPAEKQANGLHAEQVLRECASCEVLDALRCSWLGHAGMAPHSPPLTDPHGQPAPSSAATSPARGHASHQALPTCMTKPTRRFSALVRGWPLKAAAPSTRSRFCARPPAGGAACQHQQVELDLQEPAIAISMNRLCTRNTLRHASQLCNQPPAPTTNGEQGRLAAAAGACGKRRHNSCACTCALFGRRNSQRWTAS